MAVLERSELEASPLADLHAIAREMGLDGYRRLRKADLIDAILGEESPAAPAPADAAEDDTEPSARPASRRRRAPRRARAADDGGAGADRDAGADTVEGVVEVLGNGSAFLRVAGPEASDGDVYISAAQVRRCELVSGDRVAGPARAPRRSERYPSLVRVEQINGAPADEVADGARYDELPVAWPSERFAFGASDDATMEAIEWLTPFGKGSRVVIVGGRHTGKSDTLRRLHRALADNDGVEVSLALLGVRPEEIADWHDAGVEPAVALAFSAPAEAQAQALERLLDGARRAAARGADVLVLIDTLDALTPQAARRALAAARNLRDAGSLTIVATASEPLGGETTVIALDAALTATAGRPLVNLVASGTLRADLLVGETGAQEIARARAKALEESR
ncbi:MAG TPA: Rho termination factor N-terminal domain-containing protein [Solirubrobacteraceae bacterium]|nr:Rho termination factor N-terminal domain-containing protein [Solirubrobacteraceae bacterium]